MAPGVRHKGYAKRTNQFKKVGEWEEKRIKRGGGDGSQLESGVSHLKNRD